MLLYMYDMIAKTLAGDANISKNTIESRIS